MDHDSKGMPPHDPHESTEKPGETADATGSSRGSLDRRKFVAGVSALGAAAAGCLGDGTSTPAPGTATDSATPGGDTATPAGTDAGDDTPTDAKTPTPEPPEGFAPIPRNLVYQYYEGGFSELPNFDNLAPAAGGELGEAKISTDLAERGEDFGFVFQGELDVGDRLPKGTYTFAAEASGGMALYLNDTQFLEASGERAEESVRLQSGTQSFRVEYFHGSGEPRLALGWRGTYDELLPRLAEADPFRADLGFPMVYEGSTDPSLETDVGTRSKVKRIQMPGSSADSLAVGMPDLTNYCFDIETGGVRYAWRGAFVNYGPIIAFGAGRGDDPARPLGLTYPIGGTEHPLRVGDADAEPAVEFLGCREHPHPPELWYSIDGHEVTHTVTGAPEGLGAVHTFAFEESPSEPVYFHTADEQISREATAGEWDGTTLEVPIGVDEFSVTITAQVVGR
jgi:hypothetical protein